MKNENLDLDYVQILIDKIEYDNDTREELEEDLLSINEEMKFFGNLYSEFNKAYYQKQIDLKNYQNEFQEINSKQIRLNGKISKKDIERKKYLEEMIKRLSQEISIDKNNSLEAKKSYKEVLDKNPNLKVSRRIIELDKELTNKIDELKEIYNSCLSKINEIESQIKYKKQSIVEAVQNNDMDLLEGLTLELTGLLEERSSKIFKYKKIVDLIEKKADDKIRNELNKINNQFVENDIKQNQIDNQFVENDIKQKQIDSQFVENDSKNEIENLTTSDNDNLLTQKQIEQLAIEQALKRFQDKEKEVIENNNEVLEINKTPSELDDIENDIFKNGAYPTKQNGLVSLIDYSEMMNLQNPNKVEISEEALGDLAESVNQVNDVYINDTSLPEMNIKEKLINAKNNLENLKNKAAESISNKFGKIKNINKKDLKDKLKNKIKQGTLKIKAGIIEYLDEDLNNYKEVQNNSKGR